MSAESSYVFYIYNNSYWEVDSVYDDEEAVLFEARAIIENSDTKGVKVVLEGPNEKGVVESKVIYQKINKANPAKTPETDLLETTDELDKGDTIILMIKKNVKIIKNYVTRNLVVLFTSLIIFGFAMVYVRAILRSF